MKKDNDLGDKPWAIQWAIWAIQAWAFVPDQIPMADGMISFAEGLGSKALDSNEMRKKQKNVRSPPSNSTHKLFDLCPGTLPTMDSSTNPSLSSDFKRTSPSRKLQQVFEEELLRDNSNCTRKTLGLNIRWIWSFHVWAKMKPI